MSRSGRPIAAAGSSPVQAAMLALHAFTARLVGSIASIATCGWIAPGTRIVSRAQMLASIGSARLWRRSRAPLNPSYRRTA